MKAGCIAQTSHAVSICYQYSVPGKINLQAGQPATRAERIVAEARQSIARSSHRVDQTLARLAKSGVRFERTSIDDSDEALTTASEQWEATLEQLEIAREVRRTAFETGGRVPAGAGRPQPVAG